MARLPANHTGIVVRACHPDLYLATHPQELQPSLGLRRPTQETTQASRASVSGSLELAELQQEIVRNRVSEQPGATARRTVSTGTRCARQVSVADADPRGGSRNNQRQICVQDGDALIQPASDVTQARGGSLEGLTIAHDVLAWGSSLVRRGGGCARKSQSAANVDKAAARAVHQVGAAFLTPPRKGTQE
jgi:hypothetical protein